MAKARTEVYSDGAGEWRWRHRANNGQIDASSGESFASKSNAKRAARRIGLAMAMTRIVEVKPYVIEGDYRRG